MLVPVFSIAKSENKNQVQYVVRLDAHCAPVGPAPVFAYWRMLEKGRDPFALHYGFDGRQSIAERVAVRGPFGLWSVTVTPAELEPHAEINFTRRFDRDWEGRDYCVTLGHPRAVHALKHQGP